MEQQFNNVTYSEGGLKCDAEGCDWRNNEISFEDLEHWINAPCPKCGANLLTQEDYQNTQNLVEISKFMNSFSPEELKEISTILNPDGIPPSKYFEGIPGAECLNEDGSYVMKIDTHKELKIVEFKKCEPDKPE